jgi:hypothetical protein
MAKPRGQRLRVTSPQTKRTLVTPSNAENESRERFRKRRWNGRSLKPCCHRCRGLVSVSGEMRSSPGHSQLVTRSSGPKIGIAGIKVATFNLLIICQRKVFIVALIYCALGIAGTMQVSRAAPLALQRVGLSGAGSLPTQSKHAAVSCLVKTAHDKADIINPNKSVPASRQANRLPGGRRLLQDRRRRGSLTRSARHRRAFFVGIRVALADGVTKPRAAAHARIQI